MKPFVDSGFLLTLLLKTDGSQVAWETARRQNRSLSVTSLQVLTIENRFRREMEAETSSAGLRAQAANGLQNLRWYLDQGVLQTELVDYEIAIELAYQWQRHSKTTVPGLLLLWPALAVTAGGTHFLSFDPRTRGLAEQAGLELLPKKV
jgi:hypothetical protein